MLLGVFRAVGWTGALIVVSDMWLPFRTWEMVTPTSRLSGRLTCGLCREDSEPIWWTHVEDSLRGLQFE